MRIEIEFNDQRRIFEDYLSRYVDYPDFPEVIEAKARMYRANEILDKDIPIFIYFASYIGSLFRIAYYKYVHKHGFDVRALADASVRIFMFQDVYRFEFQPYVRRKEVRTVIDSTMYPKWTRLGLLGGSTKELSDLGKEFSEWMDSLDSHSEDKTQ